MLPPNDLTAMVDAQPSIAEYENNFSSLESYRLRLHEADAQFHSKLGPAASIPVTKEPRFPCVNDQSKGGTCRSGDKVFLEGTKCINCEVSGFPV